MKPETSNFSSPVCLVRGSQTLLADRFVREISKQFLGDSDADEVSVFYADETPVSEVINSASIVSMFSPKKIVVFRRCETLDKHSVELIKKYAASPALHTRLVLISGDVSKPDLKTADGVGIKNVEEDLRKIYQRVIDEARAMNIEIQPDASRHLCDLIGEDLNVIRSELAKLAATHAGERISRNDISRMFERRKSRDAFELANAVADGQKTLALAILAEIAAQNQIEPLLILSVVSSRMRNILRAAAVKSKSAGDSPEQQKKKIARELKIKSGAAHFIWKQSRNFAPDKTSDIVKNLADADRALKTSHSNGYEILAKMIISLLAKR